MKPLLRKRDNIGSWLNDLSLVGEGAEIGVAYGGFSRIILEQWKGKTLHLVDLWKQQPDSDYREQTNADNQFETWHNEAMFVVDHYKRAKIHLGYSHEIATGFQDESLDFVFIDANHAMEWVLKDISAWWPKVKIGGVMSGHDYYDDINPPNFCQVKSAVDQWSLSLKIPILTTLDDAAPTWYVFKD